MISITKLPDDALRVIFDHYLYGVRLEGERKKEEEAWQSLAHVCRQWRRIVFQSPRLLDLWLVCTGKSPVRDRLDVWPALPLIILSERDYPNASTRSMVYVDNIIAALERTDRVCHINLGNFSTLYLEIFLAQHHEYPTLTNVSSSDMEIFLAAMQHPFPALTNLSLHSNDETQVVSDSFLGGSAPSLEVLTLSKISFPGLPKLLLSATHLRNLTLRIPRSGYFPPDAIVTVLSTLTSLAFLKLNFLSPRSCPDQTSRRPPPLTHSILPVLTTFKFKGVTEYLDDLLACIDAPKLGSLRITFFNDTVFDAPQLIQFINRTPKLEAHTNADIYLRDDAITFSSDSFRNGNLKVEILSQVLDWQLLSLEQVCNSCLPPLSMMNLYVCERLLQLDWPNDIDNELWVELLRPFSAVKNLYLSHEAGSRVALALQELVEGRATEVMPTVLPTLQNIFVKGLRSFGPEFEALRQFVTARRVSGQHIELSPWFISSNG